MIQGKITKGYIDETDVGITPIPVLCTKWLVKYRDGTGGPCGGKVVPTNGFYVCQECHVSYGPVEKESD